jgi:hypothetical protein
MTTKRQQTTDEVEAATEAVVMLEQLGEGTPFAEHVARAQETLEQLHDRARSVVFPDVLEPIDAGTLQDLQSYLPMAPRLDFVSEMVALHSIAYEALRTAVRSPRVTRLIVTNARATAAIRGLDEQAAVEADRVALETGISALAVKNELQPWSGILAEVLPALRLRFATAKARHQNAAAAALERLRREQEEADRILSEMNADQEREAATTRDTSAAEARRAEVRARQLHAERIAERIRRAGIQDLRVGRALYTAANLLQILDTNSASEAQIGAFEDALDKQEGVRA